MVGNFVTTPVPRTYLQQIDAATMLKPNLNMATTIVTSNVHRLCHHFQHDNTSEHVAQQCRCLTRHHQNVSHMLLA